MNIRNRQTIGLYFLSLIIPILVTHGLLHAGDTFVYTPEGRPVPADTPQEMSQPQIDECHRIIQSYIDGPPYLNAVRIGDASNTYNCHGYAWSVSEGGDTVWIGTLEDPDVEVYYWTDGTWSNDGQPSYLSCSESEATHAWYNPGDHSVRRIVNSYPRPISGGRDYVSKWAFYGLYQHEKGHDIYRWKETWGFDFKKLKTTHSGTLSNYPKTWIGAGGKTHSMSSNVAVPSNTLTIKSDAYVNLNSYYLKSTGGTIIRESWVTFTPKDISVIISGNSIKGQFLTIQEGLDNASSGQTVDVSGYTHDLTNNLVVNSGRILAINEGATLRFPANTKLRVYSTLIAEGTASNRITFTRSGSSGTWYGVRFENSSVDADCIVKYADIEYATYGIYAYRANPRIECNNITNTTRGVYCRYASPKIFDNTISNSDYGIYLYSSSPDIKTNLVEQSTRGMWANGSNYLLTIRDNKIVGDDVFGPSGTMIEGIYFYNCTEPYFYSNTITGCASHGLYMNHYSNPKSIGLGNPNWEGRNRVVIQGECDYLTTVYAHDHSDPFLGSSLHYGGKNAIYMNVEEGQISAEVVALSYSDIVAQDNWWGKAPPSGFHWDGTSSIDYSYWLTSDPGGGSSLGKMLVGTIPSYTSDILQAPPDTNSFESLWAWGTHWWLARNTEKAGDIYKIVVRKFSHLPEAHIALVRVASSFRERNIPGLEGYLLGLVNGLIDEELRTAAMELLASTYLRNGQIMEAIKMEEGILARAPSTEHEYKALFNLFNIYHKDLEDDEKAAEVLALLKQKYPDYELTQIAQFDVGEKVDWFVGKGFGPREQPLAKTIAAPDEYRLGANYPNPFNPTTTISYDLPDDARVSLVIYDILGRQVVRLVDSQVSAGYHSVTWDAKDQSGKRVANGIYIYMIKANKFKASKKMVVVK